MFVPCTALLYDSTAATQILKLSTTPLSISCGIHLIFLLMTSSLVCGLFSQILSSRYPPQKIVRPVEILGMGSYAWGIQVICSRNEVTPHFSNRTLEYLRMPVILLYLEYQLSPKKNRDIFVGHPVIGTFQFHCKSEHKQVKWNKITCEMCKSDSIFPYLQRSTLFKWLLKFISW